MDFIPVTYFYSLIPLGSRSSGEDILNAVIKKLEEDQLMDWARRCITSVTTDGASNNISPNVGFSYLFQRKLDKNLIINWCQGKTLFYYNSELSC